MELFGHGLLVLCAALLTTSLRSARVSSAAIKLDVFSDYPNGSTTPLEAPTPLPENMTSYLVDTTEEPGPNCTEEADTSLAYKSFGDKFKFCGNPRMFVYTKGGAVVNKKAIVHIAGSGAKAISFVLVPKEVLKCPSKMFDFKFAEVEGKYTWINRGTAAAAPEGGFVYKVKGQGHESCLLYKLDLSSASTPLEFPSPLPDKMTSYLVNTTEEPGPNCTEEADTSPAYKSFGDRFKFCVNPRMFVYTSGGAVVNKKAIVHNPGNGTMPISFVPMPEALVKCPSKMFDFKFAGVEGTYTWINRGAEEAAPYGGFVYKVKGQGHQACLLYKLDLSDASAPLEALTSMPAKMLTKRDDPTDEPDPDHSKETGNLVVYRSSPKPLIFLEVFGIFAFLGLTGYILALCL